MSQRTVCMSHIAPSACKYVLHICLQLMVSMQSRCDTYKSVFSSDFSDTHSFPSALFPALICTHLYNLFYRWAGSFHDRGPSWSELLLSELQICSPLINAQQPEGSRKLKLSSKIYVFFLLTLVWIKLQKVRIKLWRCYTGKKNTS